MLIGSGGRIGQECAHSQLNNHPLGFIGRGKVTAQMLWPGMGVRIRKNDGSLDTPNIQSVDTDGNYSDREGIYRKAILNRLRFGKKALLEGGRFQYVPLTDYRDFGITSNWVVTNITQGTEVVTLIDETTDTVNTLTASAANGTLILDLGTLASAPNTVSFFLKRKTGTGIIQITLDGGATWTAVTGIATGFWTRVDVTQTLADPDIGIRIVDINDAIYVDWAQSENGAFPTSPILGAV